MTVFCSTLSYYFFASSQILGLLYIKGQLILHYTISPFLSLLFFLSGKKKEGIWVPDYSLYMHVYAAFIWTWFSSFDRYVFGHGWYSLWCQKHPLSKLLTALPKGMILDIYIYHVLIVFIFGTVSIGANWTFGCFSIL